MIETVTAAMGLVSAGIFLAHAFEAYCTRAQVRAEARITSFKQSLFRSQGEHRDWQVYHAQP